MQKVTVVVPLYNDWESFRLLLLRVREAVKEADFEGWRFVVVNDGSTEAPPQGYQWPGFQVEVIELTRNIGHQKAIAIGLSFVAAERSCDAVIVMDSDGEDRPADLPMLLQAAQQNPGKIVFARRARRSEGILFRIFYFFYKIVFRLLTGKTIAFGNFSLIPAPMLRRVSHVSEIWNHYSGGVIKSRVPYVTLPLHRGTRLSGKSKMNFTSLILHGLSAVSVHIDTVSIRMLIFCGVLAVTSLAGMGAVAGVRLFTDLAVPGWATYTVTGLFIILMQALLISLFLVFMVLSYRTQRLFIPAAHYREFIMEVYTTPAS